MSKELMRAIRDAGYDEYGSFIPRQFVLNVLDLVEPAIGTKADFSKIELLVLGATDYCRNVLLGEGKYLTGTTDGFRILLPSENRHQIDLYMSSANKKLARALKLSRNSPAEAGINHTQVEARIKLSQERRFIPGTTAAQTKVGEHNAQNVRQEIGLHERVQQQTGAHRGAGGGQQGPLPSHA